MNNKNYPINGIVILYQTHDPKSRDTVMKACSDVIMMMTRYLKTKFLPFFRCRWLDQEEIAALMEEEMSVNEDPT